MFIREALNHHYSHTAESSHADILGDAYLVLHNRVYRHVKHQAMAMGCEFVEAWPRYLSMPFLELDTIVTTKKIPYVPHAQMLQEIENRRPHIFTTDELHLPESFHLHEAAHVIAENLFIDVKFKTAQEKILKTIMCESFANTVDALACTEATGEMHQYYLLHNCYMNPDKEDLDAMIRLIETIGFSSTFRLILVGYIHSNFLHSALSVETTKTIIGSANSDTETVVAMCEKLDPQFRVQTTQMYLKMAGYSGDVLDILNFPFMKVFDENPNFHRVSAAMARVVENGSP